MVGTQSVLQVLQPLFHSFPSMSFWVMFSENFLECSSNSLIYSLTMFIPEFMIIGVFPFFPSFLKDF